MQRLAAQQGTRCHLSARQSNSLVPFLYETHTINSARTHIQHRSFETCQVHSSTQSSVDVKKRSALHGVSHEGRSIRCRTSRQHRRFRSTTSETSALAGSREKRLEVSDIIPANSTLSSAERQAFRNLFDKLTQQDDEKTAGTSQERTVKRPTGTASPSGGSRASYRTGEVGEQQGHDLQSKTVLSERSRSTAKSNTTAQPRSADERSEFGVKLDAAIITITTALETSPTAQHAWLALEIHLFRPIQASDLISSEALSSTDQQTTPNHDPSRNAKSPKRRLSRRARAQWSPQTRLLLATLPRIAPTAVRLLHDRFPASGLALDLLPRIRDLSRTAHLLTLTPALYAALLRATWARSAVEPRTLIGLLREMEAEGVAPDHAVLQALADVLEDADAMKSGQWGEMVRAMTEWPAWTGAVREIGETWVPLVRMRITEAAIREYRAREDEEVSSSSATLSGSGMTGSGLEGADTMVAEDSTLSGGDGLRGAPI